jgi:hypothetical protein
MSCCVRNSAFAALTWLLALSVAAEAQAPGSIEVGAYGQVGNVRPEQARFKSGTPLSLGIRGRVNLHRRVGIEMEASTSVVEGVVAPFERRYNQLVARTTLSLPASDLTAIIVGAGLARSDYEVTYNFGPSLLAGVTTVIRGRYRLRSDIIANYLPTSGAREFGIRTGVQTVLGPFGGPTDRDLRSGSLIAQAQGSVESGVFGAAGRLDPVWNLKNAPVYGARVAAYVTSRTAFEVDMSYRRQAVRDGGRAGSTGAPLPAGATFRQTTFSMRAMQTQPLTRRTALHAGAGIVRSSYEYIDHWGPSGNLGARLALSRDVQVRSDAVANYLLGARAIDLGVRVGVSALVRLGRE